MKNHKSTQQALYKLAPIALAMTLAACGGTGQDVGKTSSFSQTFQGVAIDGYIARAMVFLDYDNDGTRDPYEPYAFTDNDGYYSYNPLTNTNYCAPGASKDQALFCLKSKRPMSSAVVRIDGGYDVSTGEPFTGQLSRREFIESNTETVSSVISPLTTALTHAQDKNERNNLLSTLEISEADLDIDYFDENGTGNINTRLLNKSVKLHKVAAVLADRVNDTYSEIGSTMGTPNDLSRNVYQNLTEMARGQNTNLFSALNNPEFLSEVVLRTEQDTRVIYRNRGLDMPANVNQNSALRGTLRAAVNAANIADVVDTVLGSEEPNINVQNIVGRARAVESVVIKALEEHEGSDDVSIDNAARFFMDNNNRDLVDTLITTLSEDRADLSNLVRNDFSGDDFDSSEDIAGASQLPEGTEPFSDITGMQLKVSDLDLGFGPTNLKDSEVEAYFSGEPGDTSGAFDACVKYIEDAHTDGTLGEANTRGELISGYWSLLDKEKTGSSYSLLLTIEFLGSTYQAIIKPTGSVTIEGMEYQKFRFDNGDEIRTWHSADGLLPVSTVPTSNQECEQRLPSRVGLY